MAEYKVRKKGIIYIIPSDELYRKLKNDEVYIDDYGRLVNTQTKRVIKELKPIADDRPLVVVQSRKEHPIRDAIADGVSDGIRDALHRGKDWLLYDEIPYIWQEKVVPGLKAFKEYKKNNGKLKYERILEKKQANANETAVAKPKSNIKITKEETDAEKRKVLYHWLGLLNSLTKLQNAGELDMDSTLEQLTNPVMLERVNSLLSENPNLLETDRYILLCSLLGRNLYKEELLLPIEALEIRKVVTSHKYIISDKMDMEDS